MTDIYRWAEKWGVSPLAVHELRDMMLAATVHPAPELQDRSTGSEADQQNLIRMASPHFGIWLTRNNVGALMDERGVPIRYGLANESAAQNKVIKSADLIGIRQLLIEQHHVGQVIGQFASVEAKHRGWQYTGTKHEIPQRAWAEFVTAKGGVAIFASEPHHLENINESKTGNLGSSRPAGRTVRR